MTNIGWQAFSSCSGLTSVISKIEILFDIDDYVFDNTTYESSTLYVPKGTKSKYELAEGWKNFSNIVEGDPTGITAIPAPPKADYNVYNLRGQKIQSHATSLEGLPKGVYIINGRKVIVK